MGKEILVISPHADDAELGVGGYLSEQIGQGHKVTIVVLAKGSESSTKQGRVSASIRQNEGRAAGLSLGVPEHRYLFADAAPDAAFNTVATEELVRVADQLLRDHKPDEVFFPLPSFHQDHTVTFNTMIAALRPRPAAPKNINAYAYEYPGNAWGPSIPDWGHVYRPFHLLTMQRKLRALECFESQWVSTENSLYGLRAVEALATLRGAECGYPFAERFYMIRGRM